MTKPALLTSVRSAVVGLAFFALSGPTPLLGQNTSIDPMRAPNPMVPNPLLPNPMNPPQPLGGGSRQSQTEYELDPELGNLPISAGVEDTYYACTACHSEQTFAQQRLTDARWDYLWTWMIEEQGMPEYDEELRETVLAYLKRHFSSER